MLRACYDGQARIWCKDELQLTLASVCEALRCARLRVCRGDTAHAPPAPSPTPPEAEPTPLASPPTPPAERKAERAALSRNGRHRASVKARAATASVSAAEDPEDLASPAVLRAASCVPRVDGDDGFLPHDADAALSSSLSGSLYRSARHSRRRHRCVDAALLPPDEDAAEAPGASDVPFDEEYAGAPSAVVVLISRRFMAQVRRVCGRKDERNRSDGIWTADTSARSNAMMSERNKNIVLS